MSPMLQFAFFSLFLTFLLFLCMVLKHLTSSKSQSPPKKLPPGPWKLPLIGNLHQMVSPLPHHLLTILAKKHGPIMHLQLGEISVIVISSPKITEEVLKTQELNFAQRPQLLAVEIMSYNGSSLVFSPYNHYWRQLRKVCVMELLSAKRVQTFKSIREEEIWNLVDSISSSPLGIPINFTKKFFSLTNNTISRAAFGKMCKDQEIFINVLNEIIGLAGGFDLHDIFPSIKILHLVSGTRKALERLHKKMDVILENIVSEHTEKRRSDDSGEEDLVDVLLRIQESGNSEFTLTTDNIKAVILDVFSAGSETSATTIEWALSELVKNPRIMEKAQAEVRQAGRGKNNIDDIDIQELDYLKSIVKETLRLHPPGPLLPRESRERCEINGYDIPAKTKILVNAWAMGRDPTCWDNPGCFEPERFLDSSISYSGANMEFVPFGAGRRICPGITFATANIELAIAQLIYHFDWKLPNGIKPEELDMSEVFGLSAKRKNDLYLIAIPRNSSA